MAKCNKTNEAEKIKKNDSRLTPCNGKKEDKFAVRDLHQILFVTLSQFKPSNFYSSRSHQKTYMNKS